MEYQLIQIIIENSESKNFQEAKQEWRVIDCEEGHDNCICGKKNIVNLFTIKNHLNNKILFPIGSDCVKKFEEDTLNEDLNTLLLANKEFKLGKYKDTGMTYSEIYERDKSYLRFLKENQYKLKKKTYNKLIRFYDYMESLPK